MQPLRAPPLCGANLSNLASLSLTRARCHAAPSSAWPPSLPPPVPLFRRALSPLATLPPLPPAAAFSGPPPPPPAAALARSGAAEPSRVGRRPKLCALAEYGRSPSVDARGGTSYPLNEHSGRTMPARRKRWAGLKPQAETQLVGGGGGGATTPLASGCGGGGGAGLARMSATASSGVRSSCRADRRGLGLGGAAGACCL